MRSRIRSSLVLIVGCGLFAVIGRASPGDEGGCPNGEDPTFHPYHLCEEGYDCDVEMCLVENAPCIFCTEPLTQGNCIQPGGSEPTTLCIWFSDNDECGTMRYGCCTLIGSELICWENFIPIPPRPCCRVTCSEEGG
jgi:hypothetical protein